MDCRLVVRDIAPKKIESWFTKPEVATEIIAGLPSILELTTVTRVHRGVFLTAENTFSSDVIAAIGEDSDWAKLSMIAFGIDGKLSFALLVDLRWDVRVDCHVVELLWRPYLHQLRLVEEPGS